MGDLFRDMLLDGRYRLVLELGRGGMGAVWEATDEKLRRQVAIKVMSARYAARKKSFERFEREAMAVARLRSPHIVEVHDYGIAKGRPYMVMEKLEGEDLRSRLRRDKRLPVAEVVTLCDHLAKALTVAHGAGTVHRDLKPANIFLERHHAELVIKVFDFGIAKALHGPESSRKLTTDGSFLGTPHYMSPEQVRGDEQIDHRADLWSFAVMLYRALTGKRPFVGDDLADLVAFILIDEPPPATSIYPQLPAEIDDFFAQALAKVPDDRFGNALAMSEAFVTIVAPLDGSLHWSRPSGSGSGKRDSGISSSSGSPSWSDVSGSSVLSLSGSPTEADPTEATRLANGALGRSSSTTAQQASTLTLGPVPMTPLWRKLGLGVAVVAAVVALVIGLPKLTSTPKSGPVSGPAAATASGSAAVAGTLGPSASPPQVASAASANGPEVEPDAGAVNLAVADAGVPKASASAKAPWPSPPRPPGTASPPPKGGDSDLFSQPW